jgi:hypothetical protein
MLMNNDFSIFWIEFLIQNVNEKYLMLSCSCSVGSGGLFSVLSTESLERIMVDNQLDRIQEQGSIN